MSVVSSRRTFASSYARLTELKRRPAREFAYTLQQPWGDFLAALVDTLLDALADSLLDGALHLLSALRVFLRNRNADESRLR